MMSNTTPASSAIFTSIPDRIPLDAVVGLLRETYGIECAALERLSGERDQNYRVVDSEGRAFVCKITHPSEPRIVTDLQTSVFRHLAAAIPALPVQHLVPTLTGADATTVDEAVVRVFTYLRGTPMHLVAPSKDMRSALGTVHARLDRVLAQLSMDVPQHDLLWDLTHFARIRTLLKHIGNTKHRTMAERYFSLYEKSAAPYLGSLHAQLIHNDLNPHNVLVDPASGEIIGILDFGDLVCAPRIYDVAVAASYFMPSGEAPLSHVADYLRAYHSESPLSDQEIGVLYPLIIARLVMTVAITEWRAGLHPENRDYILRNNARAWAGLLQAVDLSYCQASSYLHEACAANPSPDSST